MFWLIKLTFSPDNLWTCAILSFVRFLFVAPLKVSDVTPRQALGIGGCLIPQEQRLKGGLPSHTPAKRHFWRGEQRLIGCAISSAQFSGRRLQLRVAVLAQAKPRSSRCCCQFSGMFAVPGEGNAHGLDEKIRVRSVFEGREFLEAIVREYVSGR